MTSTRWSCKRPALRQLQGLASAKPASCRLPDPILITLHICRQAIVGDTRRCAPGHFCPEGLSSTPLHASWLAQSSPLLPLALWTLHVVRQCHCLMLALLLQPLLPHER